MKHGKKYNASLAKYDSAKEYDAVSACTIVKDLHYVKYDETIEAHVRLNLKKNQTIRDTLVLPNQFRGEKRIVVFCKGEKEKEALEAGALMAGSDELIEKVKSGWSDFDVAVATPDMMKDVGKLGMVLGRKGLMPNPKTGTVTHDIKAALNELRLGRTEFRTDKASIIHLPIGKISMETTAIAQNLTVLLEEVAKKKPSDAKGDFIVSVYVCGSSSPSIKILLGREEEK